MQDLMSDIREFMTKFGQAYEDGPRELPASLASFRSTLMIEELTEWSQATGRGDHPEVLDALVDLVYVTLGTAYVTGFDFNEAWRRVHEANMKKVNATTEADSKRGSKIDIVKPEGWTAPDLSDLAEVK